MPGIHVAAVDILKRHFDVIPGVPELVRGLRARGMKIANTNGFGTGMMNDLITLAADGGFHYWRPATIKTMKPKRRLASRYFRPSQLHVSRCMGI